jgi:hypothetical protein
VKEYAAIFCRKFPQVNSSSAVLRICRQEFRRTKGSFFDPPQIVGQPTGGTRGRVGLPLYPDLERSSQPRVVERFFTEENQYEQAFLADHNGRFPDLDRRFRSKRNEGNTKRRIFGA